MPELKEKTGLDQEVVDYVMKFPESQELLRDVYKRQPQNCMTI